MAVSTLELLKQELFYQGPDGQELGHTPRKLAEIYNILGGEIAFVKTSKELNFIRFLRDQVEFMCPTDECWVKFYSWFSNSQRGLEQVKLKDRMNEAMTETRRLEINSRITILSKPSEIPDPLVNLEPNYS